MTIPAFIPGLYEGPDVQPYAPTALDDEFNTQTIPGPGALSGAWTNVNTTNLTVSVLSSRLCLETTAEGSGDHLHPLVQTAPGTPWEVTCQISYAMRSLAFFHIGLCIRDSGSGKVTTFGVGTSSGGVSGFWVFHFASPTSVAGTPLGLTIIGFPALYLRIADNGTNHVMSMSGDGVMWEQVFSESRTSYLATPDQVGVFAYNSNASFGTKVSFDWFRRTA